MRIEVTQEDIDQARGAQERLGFKYDPVTMCPVALAATRAFGKQMHANPLGVHAIEADGLCSDLTYRAYGVGRWISDFDQGVMPVSPITFEVDAPPGL